MSEVKWPARRTSDGVLVDVTADVNGEAEISPTENALEAGGGEQTVRLLDPIDIAFNTAGFVNPAEGNGVEIATLPAGVRATIRFFPITEWTGVSAGDVISISVGRASDQVVSVATYDVNESIASTLAADADAAYIEGKLYRSTGNGTAAELANSMPRQIWVQSAVKVFVVYWPVATDPTAGTGRVLIETAEPS